MELTDLIALTVPGSLDPAVAIAACRAGARGGLDAEWAGDRDGVRNAVARLAKFAPDRFGVKLGRDSADLIADDLLATDGPRPAWVILAGGDPDALVARFREAGVEVLVEAVSLAEAVRAEQLGADGVILKGNEAGGRVGWDSAFILVQKWRRHAGETGSTLPFWVQGGVGPNTAAACRAAGARGVVVDSQLLVTRESPALDELRKRIAGSDGSETTILGESFGEPVRFYSRADSPAAADLAAENDRLAATNLPEADKLAAWRKAVRDRVAADPARGLWPVGQDFAFGATLAAKVVTVAGVLQTIAERANRQFELAGKLQPLAEGGPLAVSHGTRFPILQGPMTRVSDTAAFADAVAGGGGLPFLALALFRKAEADKLLAETKAKVGQKPWGVGILGFVSPEIRAEQLDAVRKHKPPFAIIAGGRPDQAKELENEGIATYLHVPSPGLLKMFLKDGARRFIFEGRECGGHVGPRSSFALWEAMAEVLAEYATGTKGADVHAVFAGGVHDELSAAMVASLAAGLAEKGVKVGVLLGTAYLFTEEAVAAGAITAKFQQEALDCGDTVLLETGPGHAIRVIPTPYADDFEAEKRRLKAEGKSPLEVGIALERMNLGRLRVASKGVDRSAAGSNGSHLKEVSAEEQQRRGMYMIGQVAALWDGVVTIPQLHAAVSNGSSELLVSASPSVRVSNPEPPAPPPCDVAVIGLACFYPKAGGLWPYWENILAKQSAVTEIPPSHWDWRLYYDADPRAKDKSISKWGGFIDDITFDPLTFGITPKSIPNIEPLQLMLLEAVRQGMTDAGYADREFARDRTAAILGIGGGGMPLSVAYGFRACMPLMDTIPGVTSKSSEVIAKGTGILPEWTEDSFPGILLNVAAGRVANRFNLGGPNMAIDAACGSSLAAVYAGIKELTEKTSDLAIVMGADTVQTPYAYVAFSKTHALSAKGRCRPFDAEADGIALAEGIGVAVLKRLEDAERDGDRIYSVIRGMGASSDGRDKGLTAPRAEGQLRSLQRAYAQARLSPARVGLVEAHGTGTVVGDRTEALALGQMYREAGGQAQSCALGSVKSMIGHSKCAAGLAGLIKAAFSLHYKVLPPTLAETPNPKANLDGGPLFLNTEARPWVHGGHKPRAAGVSAFGFGGTNFHAVLEEYDGDYLTRRESGVRSWPSELFVWRRADKATLTTAVTKCRDALKAGAAPTPANLAASVWQASRAGAGQPTLAVVAGTLDELREKLDAALANLAKPDAAFTDPRGIYFAEAPGSGLDCPPHTAHCPLRPKVAFLFPGQGSQYPDMLAQTAMAFPEVREVIDAAERTLNDRLDRPLGKRIYPPSPFTPEQEADNRNALQQTEVAQPALGAVSLGMAKLLASLGIEADMFAGHSYGEYAALAAGGALSDVDLFVLSHRRGEVIRDAASSAAGGMAAVDGTPDAIAPILKGIKDVWPANENSPSQTVLAGTDDGLSLALEKLKAAGVRAQRIPVACGFHSPLIAGAKPTLAAALAEATFTAPTKPVFSNTTTAPHAADADAIRTQLADHLVSPVKFAAEIEAMYAAGARVFVEVGPQAVLTGLAGQTLAGKPHLAVASDQKARPGLTQLAHLLGQLLAHGVLANLDRLYQGRGVVPFDVAKLSAETGKPRHTPTTWVVNGVRSRPIHGPEPRLLGQPLSAEEAKRAAAPPASTTAAAAENPQPTPATPAARPAAPVVPPSRTPSTVPVATRAAMYPSPAPMPSANGAHHPPATAAEQVVLRFQDVMAKFLDTQRSVMLGYLGTPDAHAAAPSANGHAPVNGHANGYANGRPAAVVPPAVANRFAASMPAQPAAAPAPANGKHTPTPAAPAAVTPAPVAPAPEPVKPAAGPLDRDTLLARLLNLVSERTGYPEDALSIDLDLEADLGVDSIKRVEILGSLAETLEAAADGGQPNLEMEKLSAIKTLRGIADYVLEAISGGNDTPPAPAAATPSTNGTHHAKPAAVAAPASEMHPGAREGDVQRLIVDLIDTPLPDRPTFAPPTGTIVLTDDGRGVASELADRLADLDVATVLVRHSDTPVSTKDGFAADLADPDAVTGLLARLRTVAGPIAGLVHLLPLAEPPADETDERRLRREVKSLYLLARGLEADVKAAAESGGAALLAVTAMGGRMAFEGELPDGFFAGHGGVAGFTKCVGYEWPGAIVRAVDLDPELGPTALAEALLAELGDPNGPPEVGITADGRVTWQCNPGPLDADDTPTLELGSDATILVTGGARGITAKIAEELAHRHKCKLVLVGSSPAPTEEPADTADLSTPAEIKAALMKKIASGPAAVEAAFQRLKKDREIRANLAAITSAGGTVEYRAVDVRDTKAFGGLIDELQAAGGIDAVIHGAGVIEDKLLKDKTPESFDRVFGTKVDSALTLARHLDPERVKFVALFASISSRYGNRGQSDYAAANEVLGKLAHRLDREWPGRVTAMAWGPWGSVGMVADLEKHLVARGLKLITPAVGAGFAADELMFGRKGTAEVVFAGGSEATASVAKTAAQPAGV